MGVHVPNVMRLPGKTGTRRFTAKTYLKLLMGVGLVALVGGGAGTFASFNATVTNPATFTTGTLVLSNTVSATTCLSTGQSSNSGGPIGTNSSSCGGTIISVPLSEPGAQATGAVTLANVGTLPASTLNLAATCSPSHTGTYYGAGNLCIGSAPNVLEFYVQEWTGNPSSGGTPYDCLYGAATGLGVTCGFSTSDTLNGFGSANLADIPAGYATTLTGSTLSTGSPITSLSVAALNSAVTTGDSIVITSGSNTQVFTAASPGASSGATSIPVTSETPNFAYTSGSIVADTQNFTTTASAGLSGTITSIPVSAVTAPVQSGDKITVTQGSTTQTFTAAAGTGPSNSTPVGSTSIPVTSTLVTTPFTSGAIVTDVSSFPAFAPTGDPGDTRYFTIGLALDPTADNTVQGLTAGSILTWKESQ